MGKKKHLRQLKELQRLQGLHAQADATVMPTRSAIDLSSGAVAQPIVASASAVANTEHAVIRRDIVQLSWILLLMVAILLAFSWAVGNTSLGQWILSAGKILS